MEGKTKPVIGVLIAISITLAVAGLVLAQPPKPHRFFGYVTIGGNPAPAGTEVTFRLDNGQIVSTVYTGVYVSDNYYDTFVENDIPGTYAGQIIYFYVDNVYTGENREVEDGGSDRVDLSIAVGPPGKPVLYSPPDGSTTTDNTPTFEWIVGLNAENHRLLVDNDPDFSSPVENVLLGATDNTYTIPDP